MIILIPECCAMPHTNREGEHYQCLTCGTIYRVFNGQWSVQPQISERVR